MLCYSFVFNKFHEMNVSSVLMSWCVYCRILQGQGHDWQQQGCVLSGGVGWEDSVLVKCSRSSLLVATLLTRPHDKLLCIFSDCSVTHSAANLTDQRSMQTKFHLSPRKQTFLYTASLGVVDFLQIRIIAFILKPICPFFVLLS